MEKIVIRILGVLSMLIALKLISDVASSDNYNKTQSIKEKILKTKNIKGYTCSNRDGYKLIFFGLTIVFLIMAVISLIVFIYGIMKKYDVSETNNILGITSVMLCLFLASLLLFIYTSKCNLYFNDEEVIKYRILRKKQVMKYKDIVRTMVTPFSRIILYSRDDKLIFGLDTSQSNKFIDLLKKKGIDISYKM